MSADTTWSAGSSCRARLKPLVTACLVGNGLLASHLALAAESDKVIALESSTIIADATAATGSAHVVTEKELQKFEYTNVHKVLQAVPGVYVRDEDGSGFFPRIGIRASSSGRSDRISIMEDGVPAAMAPYGNTSAYFFPNIGRMRSVEILKGPEVLLYGPQTTSGAINLLSTAIPDQSSGFVNAEVGEFSSRRLHAHYGGTHGQWGYLLETYQRDTDGFHDIDRSSRDAGIDSEEYLGKLRWRSADDARFRQQVDIKYQYAREYANVSYLGLTDADFRRDPNRRYGLSELERMDRGRKGYSVQHQFAFSDDTRLTSTWYDYETHRFYDRLNQINGIGIGAAGITSMINNNAADAALLQGILDGTADTTHPNGVRYGSNHQAYDSRGLQLELEHYFRTGSVDHELILAARRHEDITHNAAKGRGNVIYQQVNGSLVHVSTATASPQRGSADASAFWIADRVSIGNWTLLPIARHEEIDSKANLASDATAAQRAARNTNSISHTTLGLGVNYRVNNNWTLLAGVHEGFAPPGNSVPKGSKGEESLNYELGARYRAGALGVDAIAFYSDYSNALRNCMVANPCASGAVDGSEQAGEKEVYGLELGIFAELYRTGNLSFPMRLAYTYTDGEHTRASDVPTGVQKGDVLDYTPRHIAQLQLGVESDRGWKSYLTASYIDGSCTNTSCDRDGVDDSFLRTDSLLTLDLAASYALSNQAELYARIENILDEQEITHRGSDGARGNMGRNGSVGLRLSF